MRLLRRDCKEMWYAKFLGSTDIVDDNGHKTGEKQKTYSDPVKFIGNSSVGGGEKSGSDTGYAAMSETGLREVYAHVLLTADMTVDVDVDGLFWIYRAPTDSSGNSVPADYVCRAVIHGKGHKVFKIRSVDVS